MLDHIIFRLDHIKSVFAQKQISTRSSQTNTRRIESRTPVHLTNLPETDLPQARRVTPVIVSATVIHSFSRPAIDTILNGGQAEKETGLTEERKRRKPKFTGALRPFPVTRPHPCEVVFFYGKANVERKEESVRKNQKTETETS